MTLHMLQIQLDGRRFSRWAASRGLLSEDIGYACHSLLCDAYGAARLQPFVAEEVGEKVRILGYGATSAAELRAIRQEAAEPEVANCFMTEDSKLMPETWQAGRRYSFRIRIAPVRQNARPDGKRREIDAFLCETGGATDREVVYRRWLSERLAPGAQVESCSMLGWRLLRVVHRSPEAASQRRRAKSSTVPEAVFEGTLTVGDPQAFGLLISKGIGRHRVTGFGTLLLRPAR